MTLTLRHRAALKQARQVHQRTVLLQALRTYQDGTQFTTRAAAAIRRAKARALAFWNRLVDASWDLHDNCEELWAVAFVIVMLGSCAAIIMLLAMAFGWRP